MTALTFLLGAMFGAVMGFLTCALLSLKHRVTVVEWNPHNHHDDTVCFMCELEKEWQ